MPQKLTIATIQSVKLIGDVLVLRVDDDCTIEIRQARNFLAMTENFSEPRRRGLLVGGVFRGSMEMALDIELIRAKLDELSIESDEALAARDALDEANTAATAAQVAVAEAVESSQKEHDDKVAKLNEIIALLSAELEA